MQMHSPLSRLLMSVLYAGAVLGPASAAEEAAPAATEGSAAKAGAYLDDAAITAKVKAALLGEKGLSALDVKVVTVAGLVTLSGEVEQAALRERALLLASAVAGVKGVNNQLQLKTH